MVRQTLFRHRDNHSGIFQWEKEIGLNTEHSTGRGDFATKEQGRGHCMEDY